MNKEQAEKIIPILQGFVDGGELQRRAIGHGADWHKQNGSFVINGGWEYRLKPKAREWFIYWDNGEKKRVSIGSGDGPVGWDNSVHVREILK